MPTKLVHISIPQALLSSVRSWICRRLAQRFAHSLACALNGYAESCRVEALLTPNAPNPSLPPTWPAHRRLSIHAIIAELRRRHALAIHLARAERLVFALDYPSLPRLRVWIGQDRQANSNSGSAFIILPMPPL